MSSSHKIDSHFHMYFQSVMIQFDAGCTTEHTYRPALQNLLMALLPGYRITHEPRRITCGAPNFEVAQSEEPIGHIETKEVGSNLDNILKSEQIKRYLASLNNLLLTNYIEFRWFVEGQYQAEMTVELAQIDKQGQLKCFLGNIHQFEHLLKTFVTVSTLTLRNPEELARKMAHIARLMNEVMFEAYQQEEQHGPLHKQLESLRSILIDRLNPEQFTDMMAQTICYGLFAGKWSAVGQVFSRQTASYFVPKTHPFLRNLFDYLAGTELDERLVWVIDHLVAVLNRVDISTILEHFGQRTRQEDPVVHFYETFLAHYDAKLREVRGVYYTPEPVVSYIVRSIDEVLKKQFRLKQGLADRTQLDNHLHQVQILDPASGTGTFLHAVIARIYEQFRHNQGMWSEYVAKHLLPRLHGFELLMAAYTVAHMKLSLQLKETGYDFGSEERLRLFLTNTLDEPHDSEPSWLAKWLSEEANAASGIKQNAPVMVIVGNPPYSGHSAHTGTWMNQLLRGIGDEANYFSVDGQPLKERNPKWLNDDYVKFIRFAQWRIQQTGYGILGFVTNHGYLDNPTFRGMRQALMQDFDDIYILDLHGNSKKKEKSPDGSVDQNVFDIQQGVAIGIFIKHRKRNRSNLAQVYHAHVFGERTLKYQYLAEHDINTTAWTVLQPRSPFYLFVPQQVDFLAEYETGWTMTELMPVNSVGIVTGQDKETIAMDYPSTKKLAEKHHMMEKVIQPLLYRPFDKRYLVYDEQVVTRPRIEVMQHMLLGPNVGMCTTRKVEVGSFRHVLVTNMIPESHAVSLKEINYCFPLYLYPSEVDHFLSGHASGSGQHKALSRKPNFSDQFIQSLESRLTLKFLAEGNGDFIQTISALDVFNYMYAVFHSPRYRQRYAEFLKMDFPRLPFTRDKNLFKHLAELGAQLVKIHLMEVELEPQYRFPIKGDNVVEKITYQDEKVYINKTQYFTQVNSETWTFQIGGYQVCEKWLKDRKGQRLSFDECSQYLFILTAIEHTQVLMKEIDVVIGEFPLP